MTRLKTWEWHNGDAMHWSGQLQMSHMLQRHKSHPDCSRRAEHALHLAFGEAADTLLPPQ